MDTGTFKYFYGTGFPAECSVDFTGLVVASEKAISTSKPRVYSGPCLLGKKIKVGEVVNVFFENIKVDKLKKIYEGGENLPAFIRRVWLCEKSFATYEFLDGKRILLDEVYVCVRE